MKGFVAAVGAALGFGGHRGAVCDAMDWERRYDHSEARLAGIHTHGAHPWSMLILCSMFEV